MEEQKLTYKALLNQIEEKIHKYMKLGYMNFKPFSYKEVKIIDFKFIGNITFFTLESKFKESYDLEISINKIDEFLQNFITYSPKKISFKKNLDFSLTLDNYQFGITTDYNLFKINKKIRDNYPIFHLKNSFRFLSNLLPIIVVKKQNQFIIIDGKKRFKYLMDNNEPIKYLDITNLIQLDLTDKGFTLLNIYLNKPNIKIIWEELAKYFYPKYKELDIFIKENKVETYINKYQFILLLEPSIKNIIEGNTGFLWKEMLLEDIKNYLANNPNFNYQKDRRNQKPCEASI
jgi:hypothetical protein